jgi:hypothetical protein
MSMAYSIIFGFTEHPELHIVPGHPDDPRHKSASFDARWSSCGFGSSTTKWVTLEKSPAFRTDDENAIFLPVAGLQTRNENSPSSPSQVHSSVHTQQISQQDTAAAAELIIQQILNTAQATPHSSPFSSSFSSSLS